MRGGAQVYFDRVFAVIVNQRNCLVSLFDAVHYYMGVAVCGTGLQHRNV